VVDAGLLHGGGGRGVGVLAVNRLALVGLLDVEALGKRSDGVVACMEMKRSSARPFDGDKYEGGREERRPRKGKKRTLVVLFSTSTFLISRLSMFEVGTVLFRTDQAATDDPGSDDGDEDGAVQMREKSVFASKERKQERKRTHPTLP
jgi:hypothetical protein